MAPEDPVTHSRLAWLHVERGEYAEAVQAGDRVVALRPDEPVALWERGIFRLIDGRFAEAATDFGAVTAAVPTNLYAAMFEHIARSKTGETGRSEEHTSELKLLMRISYAGFCWKKKQ